MRDIFLTSASATIKLVMKDKDMERVLSCDFLEAYIPSVIVSETCKKEIDATIFAQKEGENKIEFNYPEINFFYNDLNPKDIISLAEYILERARQEKGIICVHGGGAVINDKVVVCWGPATGMGKTTLALKLAENGSYYSDEKVLIDLKNFKAVGRIKNQYLSNRYWKDKRGEKEYYNPPNLSQKEEYAIGLFVYPLICQQKEYVLDYWKGEKFFWHLCEEASRKIRGTSRSFFNFSYPAPSLDNDRLATKRLNLIKEFTNKITSIYYKGSEQDIAKIVKNEIAKINNN